MSMDRRAFLRNAGLLAAGVVAANQLEVVERLGWRRRFFSLWAAPTLWGDGVHDDAPALNALFRGEKINDRTGGMVRVHGHMVSLSNGHFMLSEPLDLSHCRDATITNNFFHFTGKRAAIHLEHLSDREFIGVRS